MNAFVEIHTVLCALEYSWRQALALSLIRCRFPLTNNTYGHDGRHVMQPFQQSADNMAI